MEIVRIFWGDDARILKEIPNRPIFNKEVVLTNSLEKIPLFEKRGYRTVYFDFNQSWSTPTLQYNYKLEGIAIADELFNEYLFLDWDVEVLKELDSSFFDRIRVKPFSVPLYSFPYNYFESLESTNDLNRLKWIKLQEKFLHKYSWNLSNNWILPNFGFYYSNNIKIGKKLLDISKKLNLQTCVEEFALFYYLNCSLQTYIQNYEPFCIWGRAEDTLIHPSQKQLHKSILSLENKDIYFKHI